MLSHRTSLVLSLDVLLVVIGSLGGLLRSLALLGRGVALVVVVVLDSRLLAALLRSSLGLWGGERGVCSVGKESQSASRNLKLICMRESAYRRPRRQHQPESEWRASS